MLKKNDILSSQFFDFDIFAPSDDNLAQIAPDQSNQFNTLVVYQPDAIDAELETFLSNILTAAKLDMSKDVCLLKLTAESGFSFIRLKTNTNLKKIIIFGLAPKQLGINLDLKWYEPMVIQGYTFLLANALAEIKADTNKKRALWNSIQKIYLK